MFLLLVPPREMIPRPSLSDSWQPAAASSASGSCPTEVASLSPFRPTVNSLLHLLGSWLLEASLVGVRVYGSKMKGSFLNFFFFVNSRLFVYNLCFKKKSLKH